MLERQNIKLQREEHKNKIKAEVKLLPFKFQLDLNKHENE